MRGVCSIKRRERGKSRPRGKNPPPPHRRQQRNGEAKARRWRSGILQPLRHDPRALASLNALTRPWALGKRRFFSMSVHARHRQRRFVAAAAVAAVEGQAAKAQDARR
ncbi:uncharacterized protein Tco025E_04955 [Trypanosoma conorhini]|uniref:Uncharacterized protein n=1 Tax=Trypanosoma conorhini TaxID=83891 RepID=A0A3R7KY06_9TRYP|nr:uncharacterized protein Tco025E_04955 [Trypanosoma conorhini]RNF17338.1 hypothetical protein Tco025E_04955 [Trypanosoma conorhini]